MVVPNDKYTAAAFKAEIDNVENAPEGTRNHQLFASCCALCEFVNSGTLDENTVRDAMADAGRSAGLDDLEIERTIQSAFDKTVGVARMIPERAESVGGAEKVVLEATDDPETATPARSAVASFKSRFLSRTALRDLPEPTPLIDNVLDRGTIGLLVGKWGSAKSFIALDWACSVAAGRAWQGRKTAKAKVLYVVAEGAFGFDKRVNAWETAWKIPLTDEQIAFLPIPANLMSDDVDALINDIRDGGFEFIILDTLARCAVGAEENSAKDVGIITDAMGRLRDATPGHRGVVIAAHHCGKDGLTLRGSSAFEANVDTLYFVENDNGRLSLHREKRKDGPKDDRHTLQLSQVQGTGSCIIEALSGESAAAQDDSSGQLKKIFITMFAATGASWAEVKSVAAEQGMSASSLGQARQRLLNEGWLRIVGNGKSTRQYFEMTERAKAEN